jgi:hypothetical protein
MDLLTIPKPPEEVLIDFQRIARRWDSHAIVVEEQLKRAGIPIIEIPQKPKLGCRFSDLLKFEEHLRQAKAAKNATKRKDQ